MTPAARQRLGRSVRRRRIELGLTVSAASQAAGLARMTWDALEKGSRATRDANYARIERALWWQSGSVEAVLDGGEPTPLLETESETPPEPDAGESHPVDPIDRSIAAIEAEQDAPLSWRQSMIALLRAVQRQGRAPKSADQIENTIAAIEGEQDAPQAWRDSMIALLRAVQREDRAS